MTDADLFDALARMTADLDTGTNWDTATYARTLFPVGRVLIGIQDEFFHHNPSAMNDNLYMLLRFGDDYESPTNVHSLEELEARLVQAA